MGCIKLHILNERYESTELKVSCINKALTSDLGAGNVRRGMGYSYFGARYYDPELSIWLSVDPLAIKYPHQSNYVYCSNNPLRIIDPDGRDEWEINKKGDVVWKNNNGGEEQHTLHAVDRKGNRTGASTEVKDRGILDQLSVVKGVKNSRDAEGTITESGNVRNATGGRESLDDMLNVFKFAADNTNVEWKFEYGKENGESKYSVGTWGLSFTVGSFMGIGKITEIHSHPAIMTSSNVQDDMRTDRRNSMSTDYIQYVYMPHSRSLYNVKNGTSPFIKKINTYKNFINIGR